MLTNKDEFSIEDFYAHYLKGPKIFQRREALETSYVPEELPHRDKEIKKIAELTACALMGDAPSSFLCYGMTGTGKTATVRHVSQKLTLYARDKKPWWIYVNCNVVSTPYRILAHVYNTISYRERIPPTGLPKDVIFKQLLGLLDQKVGDSVCFLVLDEIDILSNKKGGNEILYDLTRLNENLDYCKTSLIGISNKLNFKKYLDPRVLSSLGGECPIVFHPYNANELADILKKRAAIAFYPGTHEEGVIRYCAALAAEENGDARKALQLLKKAAEIAQRKHSKKILERHMDEARLELEKDQMEEFILGLPFQAKLVLTAIYLISKFFPNHVIISGDVYDVHSELCNLLPKKRKLTERRISDYINELALAGIICAQIKSRGYYGRTKIIELSIGRDMLERILSKEESIVELLNYRPLSLQKDKVKINGAVFKKLY
ncbi:MAG: Cdc6/Cdc18 family protein [Promethearchaeota archaeon]